MTAEQLTLTDAPITAGTSRHGDPYSSRESAKRTKVKEAKAAILRAFAANGGTGTLDTACAAVPSMLRGSVSRRLSDLEADGAIQKIPGRFVEGGYSRPLAVWRVKP